MSKQRKARSLKEDMWKPDPLGITKGTPAYGHGYVDRCFRVHAVDTNGEFTSDDSLPLFGYFSIARDVSRHTRSWDTRNDAGYSKVDNIAVPKAVYDLCRIEIAETTSSVPAKPLMCLFDATAKFLQATCGIVLHVSDEAFFTGHPLATTRGVALPDTLRVVQELVEPYNLAVSRVQLSPGIRPRGDLLQWMRVLGTNPLAAVDQMTTNADFRTRFPTDPRDYRFEFSTVPLNPSILCTGGTNGNVGGHAEYKAPRVSLNGDALLSCQVVHKSVCGWRRDPVFAPLIQAVPKIPTFSCFSLELWVDMIDEVIRDGGYTEAARAEALQRFCVPPTRLPVIVSTVQPPPSPPKRSSKDTGSGEAGADELIAMMQQYPANSDTCQVCTSGRVRPGDAPGLCPACWATTIRKAATCPVCKPSTPFLRFSSYTEFPARINVACSKCKGDFYLSKDIGKRWFGVLWEAIQQSTIAKAEEFANRDDIFHC